ncbi:DUF4221 family protein [Algoriphagus marinus]|uniref:DUF4221 family protein n=1 Tax=Algoriphagus marinus TaxID=1925762 RepID=UPI00094B8555|nr:DUF4221 family protein [Algoriphagus marinus]
MKARHLFIFIGLLFSCQNEKSKEAESLQLVSSGTFLTFDLDDSTANISTGLQYFKGDEEYLFNANWETNSLQSYSLKDGKMVKNLVFDREGPNGVGDVFGFYVQSMDSIFLFNPPFTSRINLVNSEGKILQRIDYQIPEGGGSAFVHNAFMISPPVVTGNLLAVNHRFPANIREMTSEELSTNTFGYQIDLSSGETTYFNHFFPVDYLKSGIKSIDFSRAQGKDKVVYSLHGDHQLYYSSAFDLPLRSIAASSSYLDENLSSIQPGGSPEEFQRYAFASSRYGSILYDSYRNVYYRFAFPTLTDITSEEIRELRNAPGPFAVMVFDKDLNLITERFFDGGSYWPDNSFVGEKGLYLSINHPDNPQNKEDQMSFELLELK